VSLRCAAERCSRTFAADTPRFGDDLSAS
jgi:hypothetical protein